MSPGFMRGALIVGAFFVVTGLLSLFNDGCQQAADATAEQANVVAYGAAQQKCIDQADARAAADPCIMQVKSRYCGPGGSLYEAGACVYPTLSLLDGGIQ